MTSNGIKLGDNADGGLAALEPPPRYVASDFLGQNQVAMLLRYCIDNEARFAPTSIGDGQSATQDYRLRRSRALTQADQFTLALHEIFRTRLGALLPTITAALGVSSFEPTKYEMELAAHNDGAFFAKHIDTFTGHADLPSTQRMITAVYYFFATPKRFSGGALRLYPLLDASDSGRFLDVEPVCDSLICFPSFAPHSVQPIACPSGLFADSRFAINVWICRDNPAPTRAD